jgi:hypothetical protein
MNNLPNSRNENENSRKKGNFEIGDSGSNGDNGNSGSNGDKGDSGSNRDNGNSGSNGDKVDYGSIGNLFIRSIFNEDKDDKDICRDYYIKKHDASIRELEAKFMANREEMLDKFDNLYFGYKLYKQNDPSID